MEHSKSRLLLAAEIKARELKLLKQFAEYCDAHGIFYVLAGGTLLGAVRHKGFIPWDDDIDVMMPRPDYNRFIQLQSKQPTMTFVTVSNGSGCYPFIKLLDRKAIVEMTYSDVKEADYLWVDVFPIDGLPNDEDECNRFIHGAMLRKKMFGISIAKPATGTSFGKMIAKLPLHYLLRCIGSGRLGRWVDRCAQKYAFDEQDYIGGVTWTCGEKERIHKKEWLKRVAVTFEGTEFWAPGNWRVYLQSMYGDYMRLPPEDQRSGHAMKVWLNEE